VEDPQLVEHKVDAMATTITLQREYKISVYRQIFQNRKSP